MPKIYVASSWRNEKQPGVVAALRAAGHDVYDFRNPPSRSGFDWRDIHPDWKNWTPEQFREALSHPVAVAGFTSDMAALEEADAYVFVQPCGVSASLKLGYATGAGKLTIAILAPGCEPELMLAMCDALCLDVDEAIATIAEAERLTAEIDHIIEIVDPDLRAREVERVLDSMLDRVSQPISREGR